MNEALPPFLAALGVDDPAADERALRRAYAKRLKQIDIEADPAAFQALRENLERAISWSAWQARRRQQAAEPPRESAPAVAAADAPVPPAPAPAPPPASSAPASAPPAPAVATAASAPVAQATGSNFAAAAAPEPASTGVVETAPPPTRLPAPPDFRELGDVVFADLQRALVADLPEMRRAPTILAEAFADPRLVNIDARLVVEGRVAMLLASGWRPGHENLLDAAVRAFDWESDHARLAPFGQAGAAIARALRERVSLERLAPHQRKPLQALLAELRRREMQDAALPAVDMRTLRGEIAFLKLLTERCPTWTHLVAPMRVVQARIEQWNALPPAVRSAGAAAPTGTPGAAWPGPPKGNRDDRRLLRVLLGGLVALSVLTKLLALAHLPRPAPVSAPSRGVMQTQAADAPADDADLARRQRDADTLLREALAASAAAR